MTAQSSGAKARKRACSSGGGWAKHVAQGLCRTKVTRTAEGQAREDLRLLLRPLEAVGSGRASEGLSPAATWGVARGAAQTSMQGAGALGRSHEGTSHEDRHRVGWAVRDRDTDDTMLTVICSIVHMAGHVKMS